MMSVVLFDVDGTLVDSNALVWADVAGGVECVAGVPWHGSNGNPHGSSVDPGLCF